MTTTLSNLIHEQNQKIEVDRAYRWMRRHYQKHLADDGSIDPDSLAKQAMWEYCLDRAAADDLAAQVKQEMDGVEPIVPQSVYKWDNPTLK